MLFVILRPTLTLVATLTACALLLRVGYGVATPAPLPMDIFSYPGCDEPCWRGISPGEAPINQVQAYLIESGVSDIQVTGNTRLYAVLSFTVTALDAVATEEIGVLFNDSNTVSAIYVERLRCTGTLLVGLGLPDRILYERPTDTVLLLYEQASGGVVILYADVLQNGQVTRTSLHSPTAYGYMGDLTLFQSGDVGWHTVEGVFRGGC